MIDRMELLAVIVLGFLLDQVLGDPHWLYHPVRLIGTYISFLEKGIRSYPAAFFMPAGGSPQGLNFWSR